MHFTTQLTFTLKLKDMQYAQEERVILTPESGEWQACLAHTIALILLLNAKI